MHVRVCGCGWVCVAECVRVVIAIVHVHIGACLKPIIFCVGIQVRTRMVLFAFVCVQEMEPRSMSRALAQQETHTQKNWWVDTTCVIAVMCV